jgi:hypothetical protein
MRCPNCGMENQGEDRCNSCGAPLERQAQGLAASDLGTKHRKVPFSALIVVVICLAIILAGIQISLSTNPGEVPPTPTVSIRDAGNSSGYWVFTILAIDRSSIRLMDCEVRLIVGNDSSSLIAIPSLHRIEFKIDSGNATGYSMDIIDKGPQGNLSADDQFVIGPINNITGKNAYQSIGTLITLEIVYSPTRGTMVTKSFTL